MGGDGEKGKISGGGEGGEGRPPRRIRSWEVRVEGRDEGEKDIHVIGSSVPLTHSKNNFCSNPSGSSIHVHVPPYQRREMISPTFSPSMNNTPINAHSTSVVTLESPTFNVYINVIIRHYITYDLKVLFRYLNRV